MDEGNNAVQIKETKDMTSSELRSKSLTDLIGLQIELSYQGISGLDEFTKKLEKVINDKTSNFLGNAHRCVLNTGNVFYIVPTEQKGNEIRGYIATLRVVPNGENFGGSFIISSSDFREPIIFKNLKIVGGCLTFKGDLSQKFTKVPLSEFLKLCAAIRLLSELRNKL